MGHIAMVEKNVCPQEVIAHFPALNPDPNDTLVCQKLKVLKLFYQYKNLVKESAAVFAGALSKIDAHPRTSTQKAWFYLASAWFVSIVLMLAEPEFPPGQLRDSIKLVALACRMSALMFLLLSASFTKCVLFANVLAVLSFGFILWKSLHNEFPGVNAFVAFLLAPVLLSICKRGFLQRLRRNLSNIEVILSAGLLATGFLLTLLLIEVESKAFFKIQNSLDSSFCLAVFLLPSILRFANNNALNRPRLRRLHARHVEKALALQRLWVAQDLHDGLGSHLIRNIAIRSHASDADKEIVVALELCLTELRIAVDQLVDEESTLVSVLAMVRYRLQPAFDSANIVLHWEIDESIVMVQIPQAIVRELRYILQHALSNTLQHSRATEVRVKMSHLPEQKNLELTVSDNGLGIELSKLARRNPYTGRGLIGLKMRARRIYAILLIRSSATEGTIINLNVPV